MLRAMLGLCRLVIAVDPGELFDFAKRPNVVHLKCASADSRDALPACSALAGNTPGDRWRSAAGLASSPASQEEIPGLRGRRDAAERAHRRRGPAGV